MSLPLLYLDQSDCNKMECTVHLIVGGMFKWMDYIGQYLMMHMKAILKPYIHFDNFWCDFISGRSVLMIVYNVEMIYINISDCPVIIEWPLLSTQASNDLYTVRMITFPLKNRNINIHVQVNNLWYVFLQNRAGISVEVY